jgi:hypothetical protein
MSNTKEQPGFGRRPFIVRTLGTLASLPLLSSCFGGAQGQARAAQRSGRFDFGVVGDIPYTARRRPSTPA